MSCEMPSVYSRKHPKARKPHKCCECHGVIQQGETYYRHWGVWDDPETFKVCDDCEALRKVVDEGITDCEERTAFTMLHESVFEGREPAEMAAYIAIKRKRGAEIPQWMAKLEKQEGAQ